MRAGPPQACSRLRLPGNRDVPTTNPFTPLYAQCNTGDSAQKYADLADGPIMVDVEPVGLCNMRCTMCPTGLGALGRPGGFMTDATHAAILRETAPFHSAIRYIGFGEPLMHPRIVEFVRAATEAGRITHINTNATKLTPELAKQLCEAGLSSIKFSFQGTDRETYAAMRRMDFFEGMIAAIGMMREARGDLTFPFIAASTSTTDETPEMVEAFRNRLSPLVDHLSIGYTIFDYIDMSAIPPKQRARFEAAAALAKRDRQHPSPCPEVFTKVTLHWDGAARVCCNDHSGLTDLGNVNDASMASIWRHRTMEGYRERLAAKDYAQPLCNSCWDYMELTAA
jgi:MoaA/NifB/PqqE/SkfB family radical SAM enzyme